MRVGGDGLLKLTDEEIKAGWTLESLAAYERSRAKAHGFPVIGNIVTSFVRPRAPIMVENCSAYNPHDWKD